MIRNVTGRGVFNDNGTHYGAVRRGIAPLVAPIIAISVKPESNGVGLSVMAHLTPAQSASVAQKKTIIECAAAQDIQRDKATQLTQEITKAPSTTSSVVLSSTTETSISHKSLTASSLTMTRTTGAMPPRLDGENVSAYLARLVAWMKEIRLPSTKL